MLTGVGVSSETVSAALPGLRAQARFGVQGSRWSVGVESGEESGGFLGDSERSLALHLGFLAPHKP